MVSPDFDNVLSSKKVLPPVLEGFNDSEHLLVIDLIVSLSFIKGFRSIGNNPPFSFLALEEDCSDSEI